MLDLLSEALDEIIIVKENGLTRKIRKRGAIMKQLVNKAVSGDVRSLKVVLEALGPNSERGRKEELEQSYREGTTASERVARKLEQLGRDYARDNLWFRRAQMTQRFRRTQMTLKSQKRLSVPRNGESHNGAVMECPLPGKSRRR